MDFVVMQKGELMEWIIEAESLSDFIDHGRYIIHTKLLIRCNECKYYQGVHGAMGHAPCAYWKDGGVMWDWFCSQGKKYE